MLRVTGLNATTKVPKSIPRLVMDKVRLVPVIQTLDFSNPPLCVLSNPQGTILAIISFSLDALL